MKTNKVIITILCLSLHLNAYSQELFKPNILQQRASEINITLPFFQKSQNLKIQMVDGYAIYQGDIILYKNSPIQRDAGILGDNYRWSDGFIPYEIDNGHPQRNDILAAIALINQNTSINVQPRNRQNDFVRFVSGTGCSSYVGRQGGKQDISISGCSLGSIQHEILHAAGMYHEQSRTDRDNYVQILKANIKPGNEHNFNKEPNTISICNYDFGSIMHYSATAFGIDGRTTIQAINTLPTGIVMGQRTALSDCDIKGLRNLYPQNSLVLNPGQSIKSPNQQFELIYQNDGNLVIYKISGTTKIATWSSRTNGYPAGKCVMQGDGNLVIYQPDNHAIWHTDTWGPQFFNSNLAMQDDGNLVIYNINNKPVWSTDTWDDKVPKEVLNPNEQLKVNEDIWSNNRRYRLLYQSDGNLVIYKNKNGEAIWASGTNGKPAGNAIMQSDGNLVVYTPTSQPVWSSRTYGGTFINSKLILQDDGNLVVYKANGIASWSSKTNGR